MPAIEIRPARLDDTAAISALFRARIPAWQRLDSSGRVQDVAYEVLTLYERWLHGGAWMSVETGAIHLCRLLLSTEVPLVALVDGHAAAYAELYPGSEPPPFGEHLHLGVLAVHPDFENAGLEQALLDSLLARAKAHKCARLTVSAVLPAAIYDEYRLEAIARVSRYSLPARTGQVFYRAVEHPDDDPAQITGWFMSVGRANSARQQWETLWHHTWDAVPEIRARRTERLRFAAAGQDAFVCLQQQLYAPRTLDVALWSPKPLSQQLLSAIRDWAYREQFRTLALLIPDSLVKVLGSEAEADGYYLDVFAVAV